MLLARYCQTLPGLHIFHDPFEAKYITAVYEGGIIGTRTNVEDLQKLLRVYVLGLLSVKRL
jgi:hypothetical protein